MAREMGNDPQVHLLKTGAKLVSLSPLLREISVPSTNFNSANQIRFLSNHILIKISCFASHQARAPNATK